MYIKSMKWRILAFALSAATVFGTCAPALSVTAQAAEKQEVLEDQDETKAETEAVTGKSVSICTPVPLEEADEQNGYKHVEDPENTVWKFIKDFSFEGSIIAVQEMLPYGKVYAPIYKRALAQAYGRKDMTLEDINQNVNGLYSKIDQASRELKGEIQGTVPISNFDCGFFTPLNSQIKSIASSIQRIREDDKLTPVEKLVMIASKIGRENEWNDNSNVLQTMANVTAKLNDSSLVRDQNMFQCIYNYHVKDRMFSSEAKADARPVVDNIMKHYMSAYSVLIDVLAAQYKVNDLIKEVGIEEVRKQVDSYYLDRVSTSSSEIFAKINELTEAVFGGNLDSSSEDGEGVSEDSVYGKYIAFQNISENIFVNKGKCNIKLNRDDPVSCRHTTKEWLESKGIWEDRKIAQENFNKYFDEVRSPISADHLKDLAAYACAKNTTIRQVLTGAGFNVSKIPGNATFVSSKADNDWNIGDVFTQMVGSNVQHVFIKGYNIDEKNPTEKKFNIWEEGRHGYFVDCWSFPGNVDAIFFK